VRAIFISYRREDSEGHAGRLSEDLVERFGKAAVFMDVTDIEPGRDFRRVIEQQVASCGVLLAVIGKEWLTATDAQGRRRLDDPSDFVRLETASALRRDIPVVPVLVHGASMPRAEQLPDDLKDLAFRNSVELTHARWASDVQVLIGALLPHVDAGGAKPPAAAPELGLLSLRRFGVPAGLLALAGTGYLASQWLNRPDEIAVAVPRASAERAAPPPAGAEVAAPAAPGASLPVAVSVPVAAAAASAVGGGALQPLAVPPAAATRPDKAPAIKAPAAGVAMAPPRVAGSGKPADLRPATPESAVATVVPAPRPAAAQALPAPTPAPAPAPDSVPVARDRSLELMGMPAVVSMATRTIAIKPDTKYVNVTGGEIIRFTVGDKDFAWNFNGPLSSFDLARVAPAVLDRKVTAYVAPNPLQPRRN